MLDVPRAVSGLAVILILLIASDRSAAQSTARQSSSGTVRLNVTVTGDDRKAVPGLPQHAFTISDDTGVRDILSFKNEDAPISIAILFDLSGSVGATGDQDKNKVKLIAEALSNFVKKSHPLNEYFIIAFAKTRYVLADGTRDTDTVLSALQKFNSAVPHGTTALYDACRFGIDKVTHGAYPKKVILVISDGIDNESRTTINGLRGLLKEEDVLIYALNTNLVKNIFEANEGAGEGARILKELASLTGGVAYWPSSVAEMRRSFERLALELRQQYSMTIEGTKDTYGSRWHPLTVKVLSPSYGQHHTHGLTGRTKKGYYSAVNAKQ